ncbi:MAG: hypothetical protein VB027_07010 [Gordonibacter sp.]|nr:hypothetical protein [Gordonibacter sp.]
MNVSICRIKIAQKIHLAADCEEIPLSVERVPSKPVQDNPNDQFSFLSNVGALNSTLFSCTN